MGRGEDHYKHPEDAVTRPGGLPELRSQQRGFGLVRAARISKAESRRGESC